MISQPSTVSRDLWFTKALDLDGQQLFWQLLFLAWFGRTLEFRASNAENQTISNTSTLFFCVCVSPNTDCTVGASASHSSRTSRTSRVWKFPKSRFESQKAKMSGACQGSIDLFNQMMFDRFSHPTTCDSQLILARKKPTKSIRHPIRLLLQHVRTFMLDTLPGLVHGLAAVLPL